jgi:hypothetical protein
MKVGPVHPKVIAGSLASLFVSIIVGVLIALNDNAKILPGPPWVQALIVVLAIPLATVLSGWQAGTPVKDDPTMQPKLDEMHFEDDRGPISSQPFPLGPGEIRD